MAEEPKDTGEGPGRVLYAGQSYYHAWYLSRELRKLGWRADVLNWDDGVASQGYYHGEDLDLTSGRAGRILRPLTVRRHLRVLNRALGDYDVFHFSNVHGMRFSNALAAHFAARGASGDEIRLLRARGKRVVYSHTGCLDGVSQTSFARWGETPVCLDCRWREEPSVCSDERNLAWGAFRNEMADYQVLAGGNRADYNVDPRIHEEPEFYCLDPDFWHPDLVAPAAFHLDFSPRTVKLYHAVGNYELRSDQETNRNIKSTHIYLPLIEQLKGEGHDVELIFCHDVPNKDVRFFQLQADIVVDMLTYGFIGANIREAMMLGKPCVCYLRPEWLESMQQEVPAYVGEIPVISATPETIHDVLVDLIEHPEKRAEIGRRSREFAVKWHSAEAGARRFDAIYRDLIAGVPGDRAGARA